MLTYGESLEFIHGIARFGIKPGLERVRILLERIGNPQHQLKFIHVAGTNGKGSTCAMLSHVLAGAGYRTGLYISPFVVDFRERIQLNNEMISEYELCCSTTLVRQEWDKLGEEGIVPSEFEVVVSIAFDYFRRMNADVVVLEVGMGGRYDATNVIGTPLCSVITSIGVDHTEYLGDTIEKIAYEKCGIIKPGGVTVSYPRQDPAALAVIMERCAEENNRLLMGHSVEILKMGIEGTDIRYDGLEVHIPLIGEHQVWNTVTVVETLKAIAPAGIAVTGDQIGDGVAVTAFPSRLEVLCKNPLILLDGAHNLSGAKALTEALALLEGRCIHAVVGMLADKDVEGYLALLGPKLRSLTAVAPGIPRALPADQLAERARPYCGDVRAASGCRQAIDLAKARLEGDDVLLLCGSLYLTSELRPILLEHVELGNF